MAQDSAIEPTTNQTGLGLSETGTLARPPNEQQPSPTRAAAPANIFRQQTTASNEHVAFHQGPAPVSDTNIEGRADHASTDGSPSKTHHLLKHQLPGRDVTDNFGTSDPKAILKIITRMGQRELQAKFREVFQTPTFSNNNNWLRRKLMEAAGLQAPKLQGKSKPGGGKRGGARNNKAPKKKPPGLPKASTVKLEKRSPLPGPSDAGSPDKQRRSARRIAKTQEGEIVWAKMKNQGYWPAQVANPETAFVLDVCPAPDYLLVRFFDNSHGWVRPCEVLDLAQNWDRLSTSKTTPAFLLAINRAQQLLGFRQRGNWTEAVTRKPPSDANRMGPPAAQQPAVPHAAHQYVSDSDGCASTHHSPLIVHRPVDDLLATNNGLCHYSESQLLPAETPLSMWDADGPSLGFLMSSSNMVDDFSLPCDSKPNLNPGSNSQHVSLPPLGLPL